MRSPAAIPEPLPRSTRARVPRIPLVGAEKTCAGTVGTTAHGSRSRPAQAPERAKREMAYAAALPRLFGTRGRRVTLLCLAVLLVDQVSKAIRPTGTFTVNAGGAAILPSFLGDALWRSPTIGAACDTVDTVLLLAALGRVRRLTNTWQRTAATAVLAGLLSNLVDRLGGSSVFHPGLPRGSIDWIPVPAWPTARTNIADVIIALGVLALLYHPARHALLAVHDLARRTRAAQLGAATVGLIAVAIWTTMWQANRNTMEHHPTPQSETFAQCATSYPSDGMDWVSYRPTAGPPPYHPPTPQQTVPRCAKTTPTEIPQCAQARAKLRLPHTSGPESPRPGLGPGGCGDRIGPGHADRRGGRQGGSRRYGPLRRQRLGRTRTRRRGQRRVLLQHPLLQRPNSAPGSAPISSASTHRSSAASASRSSPTPASGMCTSPRCQTASSPSSGATASSARPGKASRTRSTRPTGWPTPARSSGVTSPRPSGRSTCPASPTARRATARPDGLPRRY